MLIPDADPAKSNLIRQLPFDFLLFSFGFLLISFKNLLMSCWFLLFSCWFHFCFPSPSLACSFLFPFLVLPLPIRLTYLRGTFVRSFRIDGAAHSIATIYPVDLLLIPFDFLMMSFCCRWISCRNLLISCWFLMVSLWFLVMSFWLSFWFLLISF